ncbi:MAG: hypothetical protein ACU0CO_08260 [Shimia sp.]
MYEGKTFRSAEDGAITVDWVVLTAAIVGLGVATVVAVRPGINQTALKMQRTLITWSPNKFCERGSWGGHQVRCKDIHK